MKARPVQITVRIYIAWWWRVYVAGVLLTSRLTGLSPDPSKVLHWANRAIKARVKTHKCG